MPHGSVRYGLGPARNAMRVKLQCWAEGRFTRISANTHAHAQLFANNCGSKRHQRLEREHLRFLFDGSRINEDDTALSLELEDDDMIDAFPASYGGPLYFYGSEAYCCPSSDEEGAAELCDTAGGGSLIPSSFVSFCEDPTHKGGFTPVYEPADGCSYSAFASMSSVHAGVFQLHVGGGAIDRSFLPSPVPFRGRRWLLGQRIRFRSWGKVRIGSYYYVHSHTGSFYSAVRAANKEASASSTSRVLTNVT